MRKVLCMNYGWKYSPTYAEEMTKTDFDDSAWEKVTLPHTNIELPFNYFDDKLFQFVSCYRTSFFLRPQYAGKKVAFLFEGVMTYGKLYVNGQFVSEKKCGYTDWLADVTDFLHVGVNSIAVMVDSTERPDIPPFGGVIDYLTYGGIYRDVSAIITDNESIEDIVCTTQNVFPDADLKVQVCVSESAIGGKLTVMVRKDGKILAQKTAVAKQRETDIQFQHLKVALWDVDAPNLYEICVRLKGHDVRRFRYGFRTAKFTTEGFFLNGKRLQLCGLNRHQAFPYVGYAMPKNAQVKDADILKKELCLNLVRTSHYPQSRYFLDRCDEIGLLVFEEIPGWQHIGDEKWKELAVQNVKDMIVRDRNRPSVILWGVRINESDDDHDFYTVTNRVAHETDPTRQTAGVRWKGCSECLEDVFAINDFMTVDDPLPIRDTRFMTGLDHDIPYLVTEYMGHMFPTKIYDNEERLVRHAVRHAEVQNSLCSDPRKSGGIGWCAFDYNTHRHFGTNDKICYHGVMDMFRTPKYAACFYASQGDEKIVLEPATIWGFGERSIGGVVPLPIFTNCDKVVFCVEGREPLEFFPDSEHFPYLKHPPVVIREMPDVWGDSWRPVRFVGYKDGKVVAEKRYTPSPFASRLELVPDDSEIFTNDVTRVVVRAVDQVGNVMKFFQEPIFIRVRGAKRIGPEIVSLQGGVYAFWIRSQRRGKAVIEVGCNSLQTETVTVAIKGKEQKKNL